VVARARPAVAERCKWGERLGERDDKRVPLDRERRGNGGGCRLGHDPGRGRGRELAGRGSWASRPKPTREERGILFLFFFNRFFKALFKFNFEFKSLLHKSTHDINKML
jgi:hypothetical protein